MSSSSTKFSFVVSQKGKKSLFHAAVTSTSKPETRHQLCSLRSAESKDDLRSGMFTIAADDPDGSPEPDVHHVVVDEVRGSVTWRYPEPRALSHLTVAPVPFVATSDVIRYVHVSAVLNYLSVQSES